MNQSDYFRSRKAYKGHRKHKILPIVSISIAILAIIFFLSFYISYNNISSSKDISKDVNSVIEEKNMEIERLQSLIEEQGNRIIEYRDQALKQDLITEDLKASVNKYKGELEEVKKASNNNVKPSQTEVKSDNANRLSSVYKDVYQKLDIQKNDISY